MSGGVSFRTRFAPSPTGRLHAGHAYSAYLTFATAEAEGGECLLRIEDIDQTRCRPEFDAGILEDLSWLGFDWPEPVRRQSTHIPDYQSALAELTAKGLTYRCFLTRREVEVELDRRGVEPSPAGERPFPGPAKKFSSDEIRTRVLAGESYVTRLSLAACRDYLGEAYHRLSFVETGDAPGISTGDVKACPDWLGDVVLERKDVPTSYHMAVCHDDNLQGITHVIRGADLAFATHIHVLLQALLGYAQPVYHHHGLILDEADNKLAKSRGSKSLRDLRAEGVSPADLRSRWTR